MKPRPRILLADDHALMLESIRAVLAPYYEIAGIVTDGRQLVEDARRLMPDLIVTDIRLPNLNGIDAAIEIKTILPDMKLLFVTMHSNSTYVKAALEAGGSGYILKSVAPDELLDAVRSVLNGRIYVSPGLSTEHLNMSRQSGRVPASGLSLRERETLQRIAVGWSATEIAQDMNISVKTVAYHRMKIKRKLGLKTNSEMMQYATESGLQQLVLSPGRASAMISKPGHF